MRRSLIPHILLGIGLALSVAGADAARDLVESRQHVRFSGAAERLKAAIDSRIDSYLAMLLGGAGLFAASEDVSPTEFKAYVDRLDVRRRYPGIQGIGFSRIIPPESRDRITASIRKHYPGFEFHPAGDRPVHHAIVYLEPPDDRNMAALGFDMYTEEYRRQAMDRARDEGAPAATRRVKLLQEIDPATEQAGFLIYVPVYIGGDVPATVEERQAKLLGFVYSPFRASDLMDGIAESANTREVTFDVLDWPEGGVPQSLHRGGADSEAASRLVSDLETRVAGQRWVLRIRAVPEFGRIGGWRLAGFVATIGTLLSLALFSVTRTQITARMAAERTAEELRRSGSALRAANRAKDEFLAVVSHELRTPLNAIVGWVSMLRRDMVPPHNRSHALDVIARNAAAQARLIEDLLDISRAVSGRLSLEIGELDVEATLRAAVDSVKPAAVRHGLALECHFDPGLGAITGDPARLQQVVLNVLSNGIKFTPAGGTVTISASRQRDGVVIRVTDTGVGISRSFLPHVFERFRQEDTSTTRAHSGIGVGLAIARHIVEMHAGKIEVTSDGEGRGTTCTIVLPGSQQLAEV
jgi:signal transduction histidine kinase